MKFKVNVHKIEPVAEMNVEADCQVDAMKKAFELLDTNNKTYILVVEKDSPAADICATHLQNIMAEGLNRAGYKFNDGNVLWGLKRVI